MLETAGPRLHVSYAGGWRLTIAGGYVLPPPPPPAHSAVSDCTSVRPSVSGRDRKRNFLAMRLYQRQEHPQKMEPARLKRKLGRLQLKYREQLPTRKPKWSE